MRTAAAWCLLLPCAAAFAPPPPPDSRRRALTTRSAGAGELLAEVRDLARLRPTRDDIVRLSDNHLLTIFRVDSCHPYWKSITTDGGVAWGAPIPLPFGSARPKLLRLPNGRLRAPPWHEAACRSLSGR